MSLTARIRDQWRHWNASRTMTEYEQMLTLLRQGYIEESQDVSRLSCHAERMYYPQFRESLLRIAAEEQTHVDWIREQLLTRWEEIPTVSYTPPVGKNSWECLKMDVEGERHCCDHLLRVIRLAERLDTKLADGLQRMRHEERRHHEELLDMMMKSQPDAPPFSSPETARQ
jgi:rubrerythrin